MSLVSLRKKHPRFIYEAYSYYVVKNDLYIKFTFTLEPNIQFTPKIVIRNINTKRVEALPIRVLDNLIFHLGLAEIPSYWKAACSPEIIIRAGYLSKPQIAWWKDLLKNGMGEFFYMNNIRYNSSSLTITSEATETLAPCPLALANRYLVPIGGGKDSIVTADMLTKNHREWRAVILGDVPAARNVAQIASKTLPIQIDRSIDPMLLTLNKKGYLNGHVPFSAYLAFLSALVAVLFDYKHIAISQEKSSNTANLTWCGMKVNHQYSKSAVFEKKFQSYANKYLATQLHYYSPLRSFYELEIAERFSHIPKYFPVFKSCNKNLKQNSWCKKCAKCMSIYILLAPFLKEKEMKKIFGKNLLDDPALWHFIPEMLGQTKNRPFECIGTEKETKKALQMTVEKYQKEDARLPCNLRRFSLHSRPKAAKI